MKSETSLQSVPSWFIPYYPSQVDKRNRTLPHWNQDGGTYFVTFRQADSISKATETRWRDKRINWLNQNPKPWNNETAERYRMTFTENMETLLDRGFGSCMLGNPELRAIVYEALLFFLDDRYYLDSFVIMPNHVHVLVSPIFPHKLSEILQCWKSFTSHQICKAAKIRSPFWLNESWDHLVRREGKLVQYRKYIIENPQKAGLQSDQYSLWLSCC